MINLNKTVGELASELPCATRVFEKFGIDYCCGGNRPFYQACAVVGVPVEKVTETLEQYRDQIPIESFIDWSKQSLTDLCDYIEAKHHTFTLEEIDRINRLMEKVITAHGERHLEVSQLQIIFRTLVDDLMPHMQKEEEVLFPYIRAMEQKLASNQALPRVCFGTVKSPVQIMMMEHEAAGEILEEIRSITGDFNPPADGCNTFRALYQALNEFEQDLHRHIHLENNLLFPRAVGLEKCSRN